MIDKNKLAREILGAEIERRQDELIELEATWERLGGTFDPPQPEMKLLTGPKQKKLKKKKSKRKSKTAPPVSRGPKASITVNGKSIEMKKSHCNIVEIMLAGAGHVFSNADVATAAGKQIVNPTSLFNTINKRLEPAGVHIINVPRQGWKLEKIA